MVTKLLTIMADHNYTTFCLHCNNYLPPRTFRNHRETYYDTKNNVWKKNDMGSSDEDMEAMEGHLGCGVLWDSDDCLNNSGSDSNNENQENLLYHEIWDDTQRAEVDQDFVESDESQPSVGVQSTSVHPLRRAFSWCLVILLAYFWTCFCISDNGMEFLLAGIKQLCESFSFTGGWFAGLAIVFPGSLYCFKRELGLTKDKFLKYVVCPKCHTLYKFEECYRTVGSNNLSKQCSFVKFPNHRQRWRCRPCGETLLKEVTSKDNMKRLYPYKVYCYQSLVDSLKRFVKRPNFAAHVVNCGVLGKCVPPLKSSVMFSTAGFGEIFRSSKIALFSAPRNYMLMLNVRLDAAI